jgi:hypothetical protein
VNIWAMETMQAACVAELEHAIVTLLAEHECLHQN